MKCIEKNSLLVKLEMKRSHVAGFILYANVLYSMSRHRADILSTGCSYIIIIIIANRVNFKCGRMLFEY